MSDTPSGSAAVSKGSSIDTVALATTAIAGGILLVVSALVEYRAAATVGFVLAEAIALYVGYGAVTRAAVPTVRRLLGTD